MAKGKTNKRRLRNIAIILNYASLLSNTFYPKIMFGVFEGLTIIKYLITLHY